MNNIDSVFDSKNGTIYTLVDSDLRDYIYLLSNRLGSIEKLAKKSTVDLDALKNIKSGLAKFIDDNILDKILLAGGQEKTIYEFDFYTKEQIKEFNFVG